MGIHNKNNLEFEIRDIGGLDVYYKRIIGDKLWLFSTKEEFEQNINTMDKGYTESEISKGAEIELEHEKTLKKYLGGNCDIKSICRDIAIDHLELNPNAYKTEEKGDFVSLNIPLFIRVLELVREDIKSDEELHKFVERVIEVSKQKDVLTMDDYDALINNISKEEKFDGGGLVAPNGKPSNLTPEQYKLVRTPEFKAWFGDWENDPENASKVVDENGEPLVVYRGFNKKSDKGNVFKFGVNRFKNNRLANRFGHYFTNSKGVAKEYAEQGDKINDEDIIIKAYFLNIKNLLNITETNPKFPSFEEWKKIRIRGMQYSNYELIERLKLREFPTYSYLFSGLKVKDEDDIDELSEALISKLKVKIKEDEIRDKEIYETYEYISLNNLIKLISNKKIDVDDVLSEYEYNQEEANTNMEVYYWFINHKKNEKYVTDDLDIILKDLIIKNGFDGGVYREWQFGVIKGKTDLVYFTFEPNQIKLADGTNNTFDGNNEDIRYEDGGEVNEKYQNIVDEIENAIIDLGLPYLNDVDEFNRYYLSKSKNDFGESWYMIFLQENRPLEIRISDHSVTSSSRIMDDKYIAMLDVYNPFRFQTAKSVAKSLDLEFKRLKDIREKRNKLFDDEREKRNYMNNELQSFLDKLKSENKSIGKNDRTYQTFEEIVTKHPEWEYVFHYPNNGAYSFYFVKNDTNGSLSPNFINEQYFNFLKDNDYLKNDYKRGGIAVKLKPVVSYTRTYKDGTKEIFSQEYYEKNILPNINFKEGGKTQINSLKGSVNLKLSNYEEFTELVPVSELLKFREFDRTKNAKYNLEDSLKNIETLENKIIENGITEPLIVEYSMEDKSVLLIDGNHRLNVAEKLKIDALPVRVVLKRRPFTQQQKLKSMRVRGVRPDEFGYVPSDLKPSQIGIKGAEKIYELGGIIEGQLHSECNENTGCGEKFDVGNSGHIIEAERDEAVIVSKAFEDDSEYEIKGTPSEIASALNVLGDGKNFDSGAEIKTEGGDKIKVSEIEPEAKDTDVESIDPNSIIINRRSMADENEYLAKGTPKQIASQINSINGNGVEITDGGTIHKL